MASRKPPKGARLVRTLRGHTRRVWKTAWSRDGRILATGSADKTIRIWDAETGTCLNTLAGHDGSVTSIAFDATATKLASASFDGRVILWDVATGELLHQSFERNVLDVALSPSGDRLAWCVEPGTLHMWDGKRVTRHEILRKGSEAASAAAFTSDFESLALDTPNGTVIVNCRTGKLVWELGHGNRGFVVAWSSDIEWLAVASTGLAIWHAPTRLRAAVLEGHTRPVRTLSFSGDGRFLASAAREQVTVWRCSDWQPVLRFDESDLGYGVALNPTRPLLALDATGEAEAVNLWALDVDALTRAKATSSIRYTTAKIVLVGESGAGKTGLAWRLAHGDFKEHKSTHGQQFWILDQLRTTRADRTECEAILWDLAGQPDYRMIHALFIDDADLALLVFDPTDPDDPMKGVEFWLRQLRVGNSATGPRALLIPARVDRGTGAMTAADLDAFCRSRGLAGYVYTSALYNDGIDELIARMSGAIDWNRRTPTVTTRTFKRTKDYVLRLKEDRRRRKMILAPQDLRKRLEKAHARWKFTGEEMLMAIRHLARHGYVAILRTSRGEPRILLAPELLNNVAASLIVNARANPKGLGSLEEQALFEQKYRIPELDGVARNERDILIDSAAVLFLEHNVCFRETDPLSSRSYLVFPELIHQRKPSANDEETEDGTAYTVSGAIENVYASLVVLLGYTDKFTRTNQWHNNARYEVGRNLICGFRLEMTREGELDFVLYYGRNVGEPIRTLFQGLFESFLARRNLNVLRLEPVVCSSGHALNRAVLREQALAGSQIAFCSRCGERLLLPRADQQIQLSREEAADIDEQRHGADQRARFEQALFRMRTFAVEKNVEPPECFISYAWNGPQHQAWVERFATDLRKAGVRVIFDQWDSRTGSSVPRFIAQIAKVDFVIVVGTPEYHRKYENDEPMGGYVVAAEGDLIGSRMLGSEKQKETVLPILVEGTRFASFPEALQSRVHADLREPAAYSGVMLQLILDLYRLPQHDPLAVDLLGMIRPDQRFLHRRHYP